MGARGRTDRGVYRETDPTVRASAVTEAAGSHAAPSSIAHIRARPCVQWADSACRPGSYCGSDAPRECRWV